MYAFGFMRELRNQIFFVPLACLGKPISMLFVRPYYFLRIGVKRYKMQIMMIKPDIIYKMLQRKIIPIPAKCLHAGIEHRITTTEGLQATSNDMVLLKNRYLTAVLGKQRTGEQSTHAATDDAYRMWILISHLKRPVLSVFSR